MKYVLILRHAKSSWKHADVNDHDRPLNKRGKRDAPHMGELLQNEHLVPDLIISSTAKRASSTAKTVANAAGYEGDIALNQSLYAAAPTAYIDVLRNLSNEYTRVLMVGHNPGLEQLVNMLSGEEHAMPTCSLVHVQLRINSWTEINYKTKGMLLRMWKPRDLI
ncbi:MAG: histidine phosphatase family protein [Candidatus Nitrosopolaris sp.]|jgi:phosphohistidine phosphatase